MTRQVVFQFSECQHCPFYSPHMCGICGRTGWSTPDNGISESCPLDYANCVTNGELKTSSKEESSAGLDDFMARVIQKGGLTWHSKDS